jgi:hypothetical protein
MVEIIVTCCGRILRRSAVRAFNFRISGLLVGPHVEMETNIKRILPAKTWHSQRQKFHISNVYFFFICRDLLANFFLL